MNGEITQNDTEARPSEVRSTSLLADVGDACSLYGTHTLRIEEWVSDKWHPESNWKESEIGQAVRRMRKMVSDVPDLPVRLIRMRFEIVTANAGSERMT